MCARSADLGNPEIGRDSRGMAAQAQKGIGALGPRQDVIVEGRPRLSKCPAGPHQVPQGSEVWLSIVHHGSLTSCVKVVGASSGASSAEPVALPPDRETSSAILEGVGVREPSSSLRKRVCSFRTFKPKANPSLKITAVEESRRDCSRTQSHVLQGATTAAAFARASSSARRGSGTYNRHCFVQRAPIRLYSFN